MRHTLPILVLCLTAALAPPVHADGRVQDRGWNRYRDLGGQHADREDRGGRRLAGGGISLDQAVARVERQYGAKAVRAERKREGDRDVYRIRLLAADGRVFNVTVDAETGEVR